MLFWLFIIILAVGIGLVVVGNMDWDYKKQKFLYYHDGKFEFAGSITILISGLALFICVICLIGQFTGVEARLEQSRERYEAITYKVESGACRDEFGLLNKEVVDEIQEWNESVSYYKSVQKDFWIGVFYPNVYDEFETIDYHKYGRE